MSPKPRNQENKKLPPRWRKKHGAYYYRVPPGLEHLWDGKKEYQLGKTQAEAYRNYSERVIEPTEAHTIAELLLRYSWEIVPHKAEKTKESNLHSIRMLTAVFGKMPIEALTPQDVYRYLDERGKKSKVGANHDFAVLSHAYTMAIKWGLCRFHPTKGIVQKHAIQPRNRYVEDWELEEVLKVASPFLAVYINLKLLTGQRKGDLLSIQLSDLIDEGILIKPRKTASSTGKTIIIEWDNDLRDAIEDIKDLPSKVSSIWLFHTRKGQPYIKPDGNTSGFDSIWQRFMHKALEETELKEKFREHDLRAKTASDIEAEHARQLLGHSNMAMTQRVYRRKPERVKPARRIHND